jgi:hypothetical protein
VTRKSSIALVVSLALSLLAQGCAMEDVGSIRSNSDARTTTNCGVEGLGLDEAGDTFSGNFTNDPVAGATGTWSHTSGGHVYLTPPASVLCTINGITRASFYGDATRDGVSGYSYSIEVQDRSDPGPPIETESPIPEVRHLAATQYYSPTSWDDGMIAERMIVTVPSSLTVTAGNGGQQWATLTLFRTDTMDTVVCRYRAGAASSCDDDDDDDDDDRSGCGDDDDDDDDDSHVHGRGRSKSGRHGRWGDYGYHRHGDRGHHGDFGHYGRGDDDDDDEHGCGADRCSDAGGLTYVFDQCTGDAGAPVVAGDRVDVRSVELHVQNGVHGCADPDRTTVEVDLDVTPFIVTERDLDRYNVIIWGPDGLPVVNHVGDVVMGDIIVTPYD